MYNFFSKLRGFTLVELLVVIAIIGLLASIVLVSLQSSRAKGRDAKRIADVRTIQLALEEYYNDNGYYPDTYSTLTTALAPYLSVIPQDPFGTSGTPDPYSYSAQNSIQTSNCSVNNKPVSYHLGAGLEDSTNPGLQTDKDAAAIPNGGSNCGGGPGFAGNSQASNGGGNYPKCTSSSLGFGQVETCYDVSN